MSTFLRNILFMLVLFTAKSLDKISVNPDRISSLNNGIKNNDIIIKLQQPTLYNHNDQFILDHNKYNSFTKIHEEHQQEQQQQQQQQQYHQQQQQHSQRYSKLRFYKNNNEAAYLLPLHPSMQQQLLIQQEFEQQRKHQDSLQNNGFTTPFQSLTSSVLEDDVLQRFSQSQQHYIQKQQQQQQQSHNHGRYSPQYSQKYINTQSNNNNNNNKNNHLNIPQKLPQPQAQRQATKIEYYNSGSGVNGRIETNNNNNNNNNNNGINMENKFYQHNNFHIPDSNLAGITGIGSNGLSNLPKIPPFPAISAFNFFGGSKGNSGSGNGGGLADSHKSCGGILNSKHGIIQTPNFPDKFETPIICVWIIDASEFSTAATNISIVVYLNQLYVLGGLKFTEYMYYSEDYKVPSHRIFELTEDDVTQVTWIQFQSQYLEIRFEMRSLDGTNLRTLNRFLDVYGFNITYEVDQVKSYQCNALKCHFLGQCYAADDFSSYYCSCFKGFKGSDCSRGPLCEKNYCENGGTCKQIGDVAVKCICPKGFKGNKCEIAEISEVSTSCTLNKSAQCHHLCLQNDPVRAMNNGCKCNITKSTPTTNEKHSNRTGKTRFEVTIRLGTNLTALFRSVENADKKSGEHHLPTLLEKLVSTTKFFCY